MSTKNSNDTIGNRTRDLPACSAVPQPNVSPQILDKNLISTNLYKIYRNIKKKYIFWRKDVNNLPTCTKSLIDNTKHFKSVVRNYLHAHSFHSEQENCNDKYRILTVIFY
jgi:hypothetical protein